VKHKPNPKDDNHVPLLLTFLFGDSAKVAQQGASERLLRWCRAYEDWLAERKRIRKPGTIRHSVEAWRRLAQQTGKMPWELTAKDIEQHAAWMQNKGLSPMTIASSLGIISNFYRWCGERRVDPECPEGFNPADKVNRPKVRLYRGAKLLSREEISRLLETMQRDSSVLGKRDYAFTLARLRFGVPLSSLQQLKWEQIEHDHGETWVRWRPEADWQRLPADVWEAMRNALEASGRLPGISAIDYIFAPLAEPYKEETGSQAEDWRAENHLSVFQLLHNLKLYARPAGIDERRLTQSALRLTAIRLRLDEGASLEEMRAFMDCRESATTTRHRLSRLPQLPPDEVRSGEGRENQDRLPVRKVRLFKPGDGLTHGFYAGSQPSEAVVAMLKEGVQGIGEEIESLRTLARRLLERQEQARNSREAAQLGEDYTLAASRIGEMIKAEKELADRGEASHWAEEVLATLDRMASAAGEEPVSDQVRKDALGDDLQLEAAARCLVEEIASTRCVLRKSFRMAMEVQEMRELVHLVEIYGKGFMRLVRLLKIEKSNTGQLEAYLREGIDKALEIVAKELGLVD
jgi:DNA-binding transcriptional MerR regulator